MTYIDRDLYSVLGDALRDARDSAQMTLSDVASSIGVTTMTIQRYEKAERKANIETIRKLCSVYDVDPDELMQKVIDRFHSLSNPGSASVSLTEPESILLSSFRSLNDDGRNIVLNTVSGLVASGSYNK